MLTVQQQNIGVAVQKKDLLIRALKKTFAQDSCSTDAADLWAYARDLSVQQTLKARAGADFALAAAIVWPADMQQLQSLIGLARRHAAVLIPYGAGSGVVAGQAQAGLRIVVDLKKFNEIKLIDDGRRLRVGPGYLGEQVERWLNARDLTLGHFPSSISCSTVGGWVATRSAGQLSSRYGKIEDMLIAAEAIDGQGRCWRFSQDESGPGLQMLLGSEGGLFIISALEFRLHKRSPARLLRGAEFPNLAAAMKAMRALIQSPYSLSVLRVYDPLDSMLSGHAGEQGDSSLSAVEDGPISSAGLEDIRSPKPGHSLKNINKNNNISKFLNFNRQDMGLQMLRGLTAAFPQLGGASRHLFAGRLKRCRMIYGLEGDPEELIAAEPKLIEIVMQNNGRDLGPEPGQHWLARRYGVSYKLSRILEAGLWADTFEVATHWSAVESLYQAVRAAVSEQVLCLAHFSHAYAEGCSIYFTFTGAGADRQAASERHHAVWQAALQAALDQGAALSHHHGVGQLKRQPFRQSIGSGGRLLLDSLKHSLDPDGLLNPGVLGMNNKPAPAGDAGVSDPNRKNNLTYLKDWNIQVNQSGFSIDETAGLLLIKSNLGLSDLRNILQNCPCEQNRNSVLKQGLEDFIQALDTHDHEAQSASLAQLLRDGFDALTTRLLACRGQVFACPLATPLVPRAATGPDLKTLISLLDIPGINLDLLAFSLWPCLKIGGKPFAPKVHAPSEQRADFSDSSDLLALLRTELQGYVTQEKTVAHHGEAL